MNEQTPFAGGQIHAHLCLLRALIATHPDQEALRKAFAVRKEIALSATIPAAVAEPYLNGFEEECESLWFGF